MLAKGANPNAQDTNGNTCLHMLVIHDKLVTVRLVRHAISRDQWLVFEEIKNQIKSDQILK